MQQHNPNVKLLCSLLQRWDFVTLPHWDIQSSSNPEWCLVFGTGPLCCGNLEGWGAPGLAGWGCRDVHCSASLLQMWPGAAAEGEDRACSLWTRGHLCWVCDWTLCHFSSCYRSWIWAQLNSSQREDTNHLIRHEQFLIPVELSYIYSDELWAKGHLLVDSVL